MKRSLCLFVIVLFCLMCQAQQPTAVGKWDCVSDDGHGAVRQWTLNVSETRGKLTGTLLDGDITMPLLEPKLEGSTFTFKTFVNPNCTILWETKIDGKKMDGKFACPEVSGTMKGTRT